MFGKSDLVANLSRNLDRARGKRDALATDVTTLTAQIVKIEVRLSEEKNRRERDRVLGEIEEIKKRIKQAAGAFTPVIGELCEATEMAAAVVPEARELNSFLLSVTTEVDIAIVSLSRELQRQTEAVTAVGASRLLVIRFGLLPQVLPVLLAQVLYAFESNTRSAAILGVVGAGGIGLQIAERIKVRYWDEVSFIIILILVLVAVIDQVSAWVRRRLIG